MLCLSRSVEIKRHETQQFIVVHLGQQFLAAALEQFGGEGLFVLDDLVDAFLDRPAASRRTPTLRFRPGLWLSAIVAAAPCM